MFLVWCLSVFLTFDRRPLQVGTGHTVATLADASELPGVTVAQVNYSTVTDEVESTRSETTSTRSETISTRSETISTRSETISF